MRNQLIIGLALLFAVFALLSYNLFKPDKHSNEPYDDYGADLAGDKAARKKLVDGSTCFEVMGNVHDSDFRLARCLITRMNERSEVLRFSVTQVQSAAEYANAVTKLRKDVKGLPIVIDETAPQIMTIVGCGGEGRHYLGDLEDLIEVRNELPSTKANQITRESLKLECK